MLLAPKVTTGRKSRAAVEKANKAESWEKEEIKREKYWHNEKWFVLLREIQSAHFDEITRIRAELILTISSNFFLSQLYANYDDLSMTNPMNYD